MCFLCLLFVVVMLDYHGIISLILKETSAGSQKNAPVGETGGVVRAGKTPNHTSRSIITSSPQTTNLIL